MRDSPSIQFKPVHHGSDLSFDEDGQRVQTTGFLLPDDGEPGALAAEEIRKIRFETISRTVGWLADDADGTEIARRVSIIGFWFHLPGTPRTQTELADKLHLSKGRVSQRLKSLRQMLRGLD